LLVWELFYSPNFLCCIICEHPKKDLALNGNKFVEPIQNVLKMVRKMLPLKSKWKCDENFPKIFWQKKSRPKREIQNNFFLKKFCLCICVKFHTKNYWKYHGKSNISMLNNYFILTFSCLKMKHFKRFSIFNMQSPDRRISSNLDNY
jgi:hypothetical protein